MIAEATKNSNELKILQSLARVCKESQSSQVIVQLLDEFSLHGPNGTHQCLVFELLGPTVDQVIIEYDNYSDVPEMSLEPSIKLKICEQLLKAVAFIHEASYAHGGTIRCICSHLRCKQWNCYYTLKLT